MKIAVIMGSSSDAPALKDMVALLRDFGVTVEVRALSAHRALTALQDTIARLDQDETEVIIAAAGKAAHLPGVIAAMTVKPVIGVPVKASTLDGLDALLSIVQMPSGIPVATVAIDGAVNAGLLALEIMANKHEELKTRLIAYRENLRADCLAKDEEIQAQFAV